MRLTQITHHDLDGYGAATLVASYAEPARIVHVPRYGDVGPVVDDELKRLTKTKAAEMVLITDLGIEEPTIAFLRRFAAMNRKREPEAQHRLIVLDHHTSSIDQMRRQNLEPKPDADNPRLSRFDLGDPSVTVLIDENSSATRMVDTHRALFATREADPARAEDLALLVASVDALDLWRKEDPHFPGGFALDEIFWDNVGTLVPVGHPAHDPFVARLLLEATAKLRAGATPAELERAVPAIRGAIVDDLMRDAPDDDARLTTRQRMARALARSDALFHALPDGTLLSFALDAGTFQRVSDLVMASGRAKRLVNVQRAGTLSFRSIDGTALDGARLFRGGGHQDAAGGKLPSGTAFSLGDAVAQVEPVLNPPKSAAANSPFAALKNWKG
ncbi:dimethylmenaquinone methyltransferase [Methylobacterium aquaticum]|uniref:dimethylmenaquinone methyltransferase n=1 Tax=Methylobacterium aquaticum TaxID=270351 RepID=UPI001931BFE8|nr:dimethylmenaquinone methyltransferase [Methylobacterium aquaticum]QRE77908.1 dimethylmenaquinone methyltransferase [Methylobacterium aquaticum]